MKKNWLKMNKEIMTIKVSHGTIGNDVLGYDDLCVHPSIDLPERYKVPKFEHSAVLKMPWLS